MARDYIAQGLTRDRVLQICEISKYRYYNDPTGNKGGASPSTTTMKIDERNELIEVSNLEVIDEMVKIKSNPETDYGYRAMSAALCLLGYVINHKKVYRLMGVYLTITGQKFEEQTAVCQIPAGKSKRTFGGNRNGYQVPMGATA